MKQEILHNEFARKYPNIAGWAEDGTIEIGHAEWGDSFIRIMDEGGMVWEGKEKYATLDEALQDAEGAIAEWLEENT
ncbi:hypothetical protein A3E97_05075 [Candidatus Uhrbacteria bacterium RIFCSPHIGHO2_12_FULL_47_12]|nr:MAG: hypothetical protein A3E97_05075 [Candidatus Uhrbacteria bacterium RIFCSPHIGHO2_12_FULL_47_12]OHA35497.1 MAG: hypothetical protein A2W65_04020 [Candidatus Taylorbacteria bacterium RIFCSPLOWO2_02_50_13]OHA46498.1 MAG: hypothetical protein A3G61_04045 [Candidatus Taylorbacteria bacterium RIFCSPLOWO2_12_FULL_49_67]